MSLYEEVSDAVSVHTDGLYFLLEFIKDVNKYIIGRGEEHIQDVIDAMPPEVIAKLQQFFRETIDVIEEGERILRESPATTRRRKYVIKSKTNLSPELDEYFLRYVFASAKPFRYPELLYSVALTHAIAVFESFLSSFLQYW